MNEEDLVRLYQRGIATPRRATRADCVAPEDLLAAVEQRGSEDERLRSINHAMTCADCGEELELLRATRIVRDRARVPRFGFALAASLVLVVGLGYYSLARSRSDTVDDLTRDGSGDVQLIAPSSATVTRLDTLAWRSVGGAVEYTVDVRRADGTLITRTTTADTTVALPATVRLDPGSDVYWGVTARLGDGSELRSATRRVRVTAP